MQRISRSTRWLSLVGVGALTSLTLTALPVHADTAPADGTLPTTVSADPLPTAQINGVVWNQQIIGNTVYVGGSFTSARPAGSPPGSNEVARSNMLAYNLTTGALITGFAPTFNGQVKDLAVSPDLRTLYVAGAFTSVNGQTRYRVAAFDVATGTLISSFRPTVNSSINSVAANGSMVVIGGAFTSVNGASRSKVATVNPTNGVTLPLVASVAGGSVQAVTVAPDGGAVVIGGSFTSVNGSSNPGYGLARLDASTGALLPLPANSSIRNGGTDSAILSLESDDQNFYGTGYHFGGGGNVEGSFAASWATGGLVWVEDCHGDTYSAFPAGDAVYSASHKHFCGNSGGFPQTTPWSYYRATATSKAAMRVNTPDYYGYRDHPGEPAPAILNWYPQINAGTFTGKSQGPWTVHGNSQYVLMGGEFTQVNSTNQQGLVRFAVSALAPDVQGPVLNGSSFRLIGTSPLAGAVRLSWRSNHDRDNETLTYSLYRDTTTSAPIYQTTMTTTFWRTQAMTFVDTGRPAGSTPRYKVVVTDTFGNAGASDWVTVTVSGGGNQSAYAARVLDDRPVAYWRLGEASGTTAADTTGFYQSTASSGVTRGAAGAIAGDADTAATFSGTTSGYTYSTVIGNAPESVSVEAWVRTTTTRGGKIVGFGNRATGTSTGADRHLYMNNAGRIYFGMQAGSLQTVNSPNAYNNGAWHHVVGTYSAGTMRLFVDGTQVAQRSDIVYQRAFWGYWRIGGDRLAPWPSAPTSEYIAATIDEVAVYNYVLTPATVAAHHTLGTAGTPANQAPVASFTATPSDLSVQVDGSGSTDPDGTVASYAWTFGDGGTGTGVTAAHAYAVAGTYTVGLTVTDNQGGTGSTTRQVTVTDPPDPPDPGEAFALDTFARTVASGWGAAEVGGAWTSTGAASVDGQRGLHTQAAGATATSTLAVASTSTQMLVTVTADKVPAGGGAFVHIQARRISSTDTYAGRLRLNADGSVQLHVTRGTGTPVNGGTVSGLTFAPGDQLRVRVQVDGTSPTTVRAKVWRVGEAEPDTWRASMTDSTASLQVPGSLGLVTYLFGSATNAPVVFGYDDLDAGPVG